MQCALLCILIYTCLMHARCQVPSRRRPRNVQSPTLVRGAFKASGLGRSVVSAHGSRMKGATRLQTDPCHAAGTGWLSWSTRRVHREPVAHAEQVHRDRAVPRMAGHERVANEREHSTANASPNTRAVVYCVRRPSARGSEPRRCEPVAHAERVQRDRVGPFIAGHERVANEGEHSTAKRIPNTELWRTV